MIRVRDWNSSTAGRTHASSCTCFSICDLASIHHFVAHLPHSLDHTSPWLHYLRAVYGHASTNTDLRKLNFFYHRAHFTQTHPNLDWPMADCIINVTTRVVQHVRSDPCASTRCKQWLSSTPRYRELRSAWHSYTADPEMGNRLSLGTHAAFRYPPNVLERLRLG